MKKNKIKGYKVFNPNWTCKDYQYKVGGEYKMDDDIKICQRGFHFCEKLIDCFDYYPFDSNNKVAEIEALGKVLKEENGNKSVTNHIKIIKELTWFEVCDLVNSGKNNIGKGNSGNRNSGYWNSGYCNSGDWNSGIFNSDKSKLNLFNQSTDYTMEDLKNKYRIAIDAILYSEFPLTKWISANDMTEKEKKENPQWEFLGGYLKQNTYKDAWKYAWKSMTEEEQLAIQNLPNFDKKIFKEITGITIRKGK